MALTADQRAAAIQAKDDHDAAIDKNYGEYIAVGPIYIHGALAYGTGSPVSSMSVADGTVSVSQVAKVGTKAADAAVVAPAPVLPASPPVTTP